MLRRMCVQPNKLKWIYNSSLVFTVLSVVNIPLEQLYLFLNTLYICIVVSEYIPPSSNSSQMKEYWVLLKAYQAEVDRFFANLVY